jgi:hypothetical protein
VTPSPRGARILAVLSGVGALALAAPAAVLAHSMNPSYTSRLPLAVYVAGAAMTVALSFVVVLARDLKASPPDLTGEGALPRPITRLVLRSLGLLAWVWIVAQGVVGGSSAGDVATLFLWIYGWVGIAMVSAIIGPAWHFLDPFSTLHDLGAALVRRLGIAAWEPAEYPERLGRWPAVIGFAALVWLELAMGGGGPSVLFIVLIGYTTYTLAMMAQFGRDEWRSHGEIFTVWFRLLGRLAAFALVDEDGRIRRRPFASGLLEPGWSRADVALTGLGIGSILFDGLYQTQAFFDGFGTPDVGGTTVLLAVFLGAIVLAALLVTRAVGVPATGAGLLPIAVGYLIAHYLTYLLVDGQNIVIAITDPFQRGWDLFGFAHHEASGDWLPPSLVWTIQLAAVVGGHMLGAWAGHVTAALYAPPGLDRRALRAREIPLAVVMVILTTVTLWSLGQAIVVEAPAEGGSDQDFERGAGISRVIG